MQSSTADETPLIPDLHTGILPILRHGSELGSLHAPAGRSTEAEARGLPYALSVYELVRFCQKRRSIEVTNLPSVQDIITKRRNSITVRSCGETCDHTPAHCHRSRRLEPVPASTPAGPPLMRSDDDQQSAMQMNRCRHLVPLYPYHTTNYNYYNLITFNCVL